MRWENLQEWFDRENPERATHDDVTEDHTDRLDGNVSKQDARHNKATASGQKGKGMYFSIYHSDGHDIFEVEGLKVPEYPVVSSPNVVSANNSLM